MISYFGLGKSLSAGFLEMSRRWLIIWKDICVLSLCFKCNRNKECSPSHLLLLRNHPSSQILHFCSGSKWDLQLHIPVDLSHPLLPLIVLVSSQSHSDLKVKKLLLIFHYGVNAIIVSWYLLNFFGYFNQKIFFWI